MKLSEELSIKVNNLMKKLFLTAIFLFTLLLTPSATFAQGMMGNWTSSPSSVTSDDHTAREEAEGKEIRDKLQAKQLECKDLTNDNYAVLGEYFMGQSIGNTQRHALMNQMMTNMMGEEGEEQMHIAMGKRLSGCEPNAQVPSNGVGFMPMMWMMRWKFYDGNRLGKHDGWLEWVWSFGVDTHASFLDTSYSWRGCLTPLSWKVRATAGE